MTELVDYLAYKRDKLWNLVKTEAVASEKLVTALWQDMEERVPTQEEAAVGLNNLFIYSLSRILTYNQKLADNYPTTQYTKDRLRSVQDLWWVDHYTAGVSEWSTLNWFSAAKLKDVGGVKKVAGASTHFVCGRSGIPFYIVPLMHGTWHEPRKNKDSISIEYVNPGGLSRTGETWKYWAGNVPATMLAETPPVQLGEPWKGYRYQMPFTPAQIRNSVKLKRLVTAALPGRFALERMTDHHDWREGKSDMGPMWPAAECNHEAFSKDPLPELQFLRDDQFDAPQYRPIEPVSEDPVDANVVATLNANPEYGVETLTHDDDAPETDALYTTKELQERLASKGYTLSVDGKFGPKTAAQVKRFQQDWNRNNPKDRLKVDGIPGPRTIARLRKD